MLAKGLQRILDIRCTLPHPLHGWRPTRVPLKWVNRPWMGCEPAVNWQSLRISKYVGKLWQTPVSEQEGAFCRTSLIWKTDTSSKEANVCKCALYNIIYFIHCFQVSRSLWILLPLLPISHPHSWLSTCQSNIHQHPHRKSSKIIESKVLLVVFGGASPETSCRTAMRAFRAWIVHF